MPDNFPRLREMGVTSPDQIVGYDLIQTEPTEDMLRLKYQRPHGSFLPVTRVYRFARTSRPSNDAAHGLIDYEISPFLDAALEELDTLVRGHTDRKVVLAEVTGHIDQIERDFRAEMKALRATLGRLGDLV